VTGAASEAAAWDLRQRGAPAPVPPSHHGHDLERWPLRDSLPLGALEGAVPSARVHVRQLLREWGLDELGQDVGLVVTELVGNAVTASGELRPAIARVLVWLGSDSRHVLVAVADASPRPPVWLNPDLDAERGRGLALVEAFSNRWGWYPVMAAGAAKLVWAEWRLPAMTAQGRAADQPSLCGGAR
jgi:anti-sigma regulatory factor (Ser/Thr protein kinase)